MVDESDEDRKAMEWLERASEAQGPSGKPLRRIKLMLARPVLPEPSTIETELLSDMMRAYNGAPDGDWVKKWFAVYKALHARLTAHSAPKASPRLPHIVIGQTSSPNHVIETCVEVLVRAGLITVAGSIGERINRRIAEDAETAPKTKEVEVWHVEYVSRPNGAWAPALELRFSPGMAEARANLLREMPAEYRCIRVTGPHKQTVPA